jgi:hypothetical protein
VADRAVSARLDHAGLGRAVARGARPVLPPGPSPEAGVRMALVADPGGNLIEFLHRPAR